MLVIIMIIVITTAAAAVSVQNTSAEVRASGRELMTLQARYAAEAVLVTAIAYIDINPGSFYDAFYENKNRFGTADMRRNTGGHVVTNTSLPAVRLTLQQLTNNAMIDGLPPVSAADPGAPIPDPTGSFGPSQVYVPGAYDIDLTDCVDLSTTQGNNQTKALDCTVSVHSRLVIAGGGGKVLTWTRVGGGPWVDQDRSGATHVARAAINTAAALTTMMAGTGDGK